MENFSHVGSSATIPHDAFASCLARCQTIKSRWLRIGWINDMFHVLPDPGVHVRRYTALRYLLQADHISDSVYHETDSPMLTAA